MPVNRAETTKLIIDHREIFFQMIDDIDRSAHEERVSEEFSLGLYNSRIESATRNMAEPERRTVLDALSIDNLKRNHLLVFNHGQTGRFLLVSWLREMLRSFDDVRLRGLTQPDLDHLHERLVALLAQVKDPALCWIEDDPLFKEVVATLYECFHEIAHKLTQNVAALRGRCEALADIVDSIDYTSMTRARQVGRALDEIYTIHERNVVPTIQFLDPNLDIKRNMRSGSRVQTVTTAPMQLMSDIISRFEQSQRHKHVRQLQRIEFQILSLSAEVALLRNTLEQYIRLHAEQRRRYNRIEERYMKLRAAVDEVQDGRRRGFRLSIGDPLFADAKRLAGLKEVKSRQGGMLSWPEKHGRSFLDEALRVAEETAGRTRTEYKSQVSVAPVDPEVIRRYERAERLTTLMAKYQPPPLAMDIYKDIHAYLEREMADYELPDVIDGLSLLDVDVETSPTKTNVIRHEGWEYRYYVRSLASNDDTIEVAE